MVSVPRQPWIYPPSENTDEIDRYDTWNTRLSAEIERHLQHAAAIYLSLNKSDEEHDVESFAAEARIALHLVETQPEIYDPRLRCPPIPQALRELVYRRDSYRCQECGTWEDISIDHVVARTCGGSNDPENLRTLCRKHNSEKGNR